MTTPLVVICDTREQHVLPFEPHIVVERGTLDLADYAARGYEDFARIERKNPADLVSSLTGDYPRFRVELNGLAFEKRVPHRVIVVEAPSLEAVIRRERVDYGKAKALRARLDTVVFRYGIPIVWRDDPAEAARWVANALTWVVATYSDPNVAAAERAARAVLPAGMRGGAAIAHDAAVAAGRCPKCLRPPPKKPKPSGVGVCACGRLEAKR